MQQRRVDSLVWAPLPRVLLVENDTGNAACAQAVVQGCGCDVELAENGLLGLQRWRDGRFDLILIDVQMPVMDGLTTTRLIRAEELAQRRTRVPIIIVTACALPWKIDACIMAGVDDVITKPFSIEAMRESVRGRLREWQRVSQAMAVRPAEAANPY